MADIADERSNIDENLAKFNSALSESFFFLLGASINFINKKQYDTHSFFLNGVYSPGAGSVNIDGFHVFQFDAEIVGISFGNAVLGTSGTTTMDIHKITNGGTDAGSIFGTKPSIISTAGNDSYAAESYETATSLAPTGYTLPTVPNREFNQFDGLRFDLDSAMGEAENLFINIHFRPR
jgi:hypothetical protein